MSGQNSGSIPKLDTSGRGNPITGLQVLGSDARRKHGLNSISEPTSEAFVSATDTADV